MFGGISSVRNFDLRPKFHSQNSLRPLSIQGQPSSTFYSLPVLESQGFGNISRLPFSIRVMIESLLRNFDGHRVQESHVRQLAAWRPRGDRTTEIPFVVSRIVAPDSSGVPLLADLAAMRDAAVKFGIDPKTIEPRVPVDLVVDHSIAVDHAGSRKALQLNMHAEYQRNAERYSFLKWAAQAFNAFRIYPPGTGIIHQINLECLARGVRQKDGITFFDTLVGTDSHTTMINGIGVLGWGVGGIEAEAGMLGQPVYLLTPDVIGVELLHAPLPGITATDIVLTIVEILRAQKVVGKFVEFFGPGASVLSAPDRATISNMAPEYGATAAYFTVDANTLDYLRSVGRTAAELAALEAYFRAQDMFGMPVRGEIDYSDTLAIDLALIERSVSGPSRPHDRIPLRALKASAAELLSATAATAGPTHAADAPDGRRRLQNGDIVLAAITSCTNTSNPGVMLSAGLLARNAVKRGLRVAPQVKASFTPGSRVVSAYLEAAGLMPFLETLGFHVVGYGCATCMGNSGPLDEALLNQISQEKLLVGSVLSGNRNFEARIHQAVRANFLMSPPLVVALAIAGRFDFDPVTQTLGVDAVGEPVFLRDIWPTDAELSQVMGFALDPQLVLAVYAPRSPTDPFWDNLPAPTGDLFAWDTNSSYLKRPPFFDGVSAELPVLRAVIGARAVAVLGDSVTTDHINPGGAISSESDSGRFLIARGVRPADFNSYISRRAHDGVMVRSIFANVRIRNLMVKNTEGTISVHHPDGQRQSIYETATRYAQQGVPTLVFAGEEYGTGSSRDWAAKGTSLLGIRAVIARSFERIHRSNLIGMGVLPCEFSGDDDAQSLEIDGTETFDLPALAREIEPRQQLELVIHRRKGEAKVVTLRARIDTVMEATYLRHGGILPYVLRQAIDGNKDQLLTRSQGVNVI